MHNVLIVIPAGTEPQHAMRAALELAREKGGQLVALVVIPPDIAGRVTSTLSDVGFLGEQVGTQVGAALEHEYRTRSEALLRGFVDEARPQGVEVVPLVEAGDTGEICARIIRTYGIEAAILVAERRSWLTRFLSRSASVRLPAFAGCEVRVMEED